ncbi:MAG TPA: M48 family metallopeptidase [Candidatus Nitrosocosmicus sp.]|nr:M48 family metallopeptidase [Candidatus Nitrosocosmicus sp.]
MESTENISSKSARTTKEKIYLGIVIAIATLLWGLLFFSLLRQIESAFNKEDPEKGCYVQDIYTQSIIRIKEKKLIAGEKCIRWNELTEEEKKEIKEANKSVVAKIFSSISTPIFLLFYLGFGLFSHLSAMAYIRMNAVKISKRQFPEFYEALLEQSKKLGMATPPDMYILLGNGVLNAFATRLVFRRLLIIYSNLAEALIEGKDQRQLEAVMAHELGHHALGHTHPYNILLIPGLLIPFLGTALSRAREYSADRIMSLVIKDKAICQRSLMKLAAGAVLGRTANIVAFTDQAYEESGFFTWVAEISASHPHLSKRVYALEEEKTTEIDSQATKNSNEESLEL